MTTLLLLLSACNDTPTGDSAGEPPLTCREWCGEVAACDLTYAGWGCIEMCDHDERDADEWSACLEVAVVEHDIATYGWDYDGCHAVEVDCGMAPGAL